MQSWKAHLADEAGTIALGAALARILQPGLIMHLHGELGAGKTSLTRALLHAAGHLGRVKSPTYSLVESYAVTLNGMPVQVLHFDLYRMSNPQEFIDAGLREYFDGSSICIVEWPERANDLLPPPDLAAVLKIAGNGRDVKLGAFSTQGESCLDRLHLSPNL